MKVVCIVQARMGSTRLPGKVLKEICGITVLEHCINRLRKVSNIDEIVTATTTKDEDDIIVDEAKKLGVNFFRGSEENVLERYYWAAKENYADVVVRVTSDCPLIDYEVSEDIIDFFIRNKDSYDYVSNTINRTYPRGLDIEVFSFQSLEKAFKNASLERDKEHVTPYIWSNPNIFRIYQYTSQVDLSNIRVTLDTQEDFNLINCIYENLNFKGYFGLDEIMEFINNNNKILEMNSSILQKKV